MKGGVFRGDWARSPVLYAERRLLALPTTLGLGAGLGDRSARGIVEREHFERFVLGVEDGRDREIGNRPSPAGPAGRDSAS